ncbi:MAG: urease accessory UreF family protein [Candidatus Acidiferrales bacterium]|jgi:urease accessory protein
MERTPANHAVTLAGNLADLQLLHLADSALPIGALAHSFGLESLTACELLTTRDLPDFLRAYLEECGMMEAVFCRAAFRLPATVASENEFAIRWFALNNLLSARKPGRESRAGSGSLGGNFLQVALNLTDHPLARTALHASKHASSLMHHSTAFGLTCSLLGLTEERVILVYLHQSIASLLSSCQRLLPLGQSEAAKLLWNLKPAIIETANRSATCALDDAWCFMPLLDWGAMEHPALSTRLFIS